LTLYRLTNGKFAPLSGATVDVWHADALGVYSDEDAPMNHENTAGQKWLRGFQVSDKNGLVTFQTIFPGWYRGRTTHIHFKVRETVKGQTKEFTSQLFFDDTLADTIFGKAPY
ncbi:dioxygenase family protein, partial [Streptobacillus moniliformis]|uniref:dioxygenase family protein n=1 Tax=Streptobacillus moniliformis TaxID=34105 RepID=UPI0018C86F0D